MENKALTYKEKKGILTGMLLGDAGKHNNNLYIGHSVKQKDYAMHKKALLEEITGKKVSVTYRNCLLGERYFGVVLIHPRICHVSKRVVKAIYSNGRKHITQTVLEWLTPQGIAIWFMDDGSCSAKQANGHFRGVNITLNTYVPPDETELIRRYFSEKWGINWYLNKSKNKLRLGMGTIEGRKFKQFISLYIIPSMAYKVAIPEAKNKGYGNMLNPTNEIHGASCDEQDGEIVQS